MSISFSKYHGAGNDFILIDDRSASFLIQAEKKNAQLCHRQRGIGADGLILLQKGTSAAYRMRIFNSDGKEAAMCGNGLRCLAAFIQSLGLSVNFLEIESQERTHRCVFTERGLSVSLG